MISYQLDGLEIFVDLSPGTPTVGLSGQLDLANVALLEHVLTDLCYGAPFEVIIDLAQIGFFGVCGINALLKTALRLRSAGRELRIVNAAQVTTRALHVLKLEWLLGVSGEATVTFCSNLMCKGPAGADCPDCPPGHHYCSIHSHHPDHGLFRTTR